MKNNLLKYYITALYLCCTFVTFAQTPGTDNGSGTLELDGDSTPVAPIGDYVWGLALVGLVYVFFRLRAYALQENASK